MSTQQDEQTESSKQTKNITIASRGVNIEGNVSGPIITGDHNTVEQTFIQKTPNWLIGVILFVSLTSIAGIMTVIWKITPKPKTEMAGDFRIAVAQMQWEGKNEPNSISKSLSNNVALNLQKLIEEMNPTFVITVWGPDQAGQIEGKNKTERAESAAKIAERIKADIVVYGVINGEKLIWKIQPEFYISDRSETLSDAQEITGEHAIGKPFNSSSGDLAGRITLSEHLRERTELLSQIVLGVAFYSAQDYKRALEFFESKENAEVWETVGGKELLYLLIGNAAGKDELYAKAETSFLIAQNINSEYSRAYAGLGGVRYIQALEQVPQKDGSEDFTKANIGLLYESLSLFQSAQDSKNKPILADIDSKVHFGRGQALFALTLAGKEIDPNEIAHEFLQVINEYGDLSNPNNKRIWYLAAESYARLGLMFLLSDNLEQAKVNYEKAVEILETHPERQQFYQDRLDEINRALLENAP